MAAQDDADQRVDAFANACQGRGLRVTPQRAEVYRVVVLATDHPSVDAVYRRVRARLPNVSLDTVYRTLGTLTDHGLIRRVEVLDDRARYDANLVRHHHCVCVRCQSVADVVWPELDELGVPAAAGQWGTVDSVCAEIRGVCHACREAGRRA